MTQPRAITTNELLQRQIDDLIRRINDLEQQIVRMYRSNPERGYETR